MLKCGKRTCVLLSIDVLNQILQKDYESNRGPNRHAVHTCLLEELKYDSISWLGESKYMHGLTTNDTSFTIFKTRFERALGVLSFVMCSWPGKWDYFYAASDHETVERHSGTNTGPPFAQYTCKKGILEEGSQAVRSTRNPLQDLFLPQGHR
jgi:hypothetical protein